MNGSAIIVEMQSRERWLLIALIAIPLLAAAVLQLSPRPLEVEKCWQAYWQLLQRGHPSEAADYLARLTVIQPWGSSVWEKIGLAKLQAGDAEAAVSAFRQHRSQETLSVEGQIAFASALGQAGEEESAIQAWRDLAANEQIGVDQLQLIYNAQMALGDSSGATDTLRAWIAVEPDHAWANARLGVSLLVDDKEAGLAALEHAAANQPSLTQTYLVLRQAVRAAERLEDPAIAQVTVGRALAQVGEWEAARLAFLSATEHAPLWGDAWAFLAEAQQNVGDSGSYALDKAEELSPDSTIVKALRALYWRRRGEPLRGLPYLQAIASAEPNSVVWQIELGNTYADAGQLAESLQSYQNAVELDPSNAQAWQALAAFSARFDIEVQAIGLPAARQAVVLAPNDPAALDLLGLMLFGLRDYESAERFLQQALIQAPDHALAHLHLGQLYLEQDEPEAARSQLEEALRLAGNSPVGEMAESLLNRTK